MTNEKNDKRRLDRRRFMQSSAALAAAGIVAAPLGAKGLGFFRGSDTLRVGLVGCGGRGTGAAVQALRADEGAVLVAMADVFKDKLDASLAAIEKAVPGKVQVAEDHRFVGFDAYARLLASGVDVVLLATPPYFRPQHLEAAVQAGKHVFCEKPMAVDGPGVRSVLATVEKARQKDLCIVSGFCWRYSTPERETFQRINDGALGRVQAVYTTYNTSPLHINQRQDGWTDMEWQLRNWQHFTWLAGDHIAEQAVHSLDKMAWAMNGEVPEKCVAVGGRIARVEPERGNVYDHFSVTYGYESGARGFHMCRQIAGCANDNSDLVMGTKGTCSINGWAPRHVITGENPWRCKTPRNDMYQQEHDELFAAIRSGKSINDGVWMTHSTLLALMGRLAAYTGQEVSWQQALDSQETLGPEKLAWGELAMAPVRIPGRTKLI